MSSYFFRHCLVFSLMTTSRFRGSAGLLRGAVANAFMCGQWERKGKHTDIYIAVLCSVGSGKCPSFCCKDFIVTFLNCRFMSMSVLTQQFSPFPVRAITCNRPGSVDA
jgi:hypothetical protein